MTRRTIRLAYFLSILAAVVIGTFALLELRMTVQDALGPNRLVVPLQLERSGNVQLFYDRGAGINETDSATIHAVGTNSLKDAIFALPRVPITKLRFDPPPEWATSRSELRVSKPRAAGSSPSSH